MSNGEMSRPRSETTPSPPTAHSVSFQEKLTETSKVIGKLKLGGNENSNGEIVPEFPRSAEVRKVTKPGALNRNRKTRSLYGVSPDCKFGPKAYLQENTDFFLKIPDPSSQKLSWAKPPLSVLVVRKLYDADITYPFKDLVVWLIEEKNMVVYADRAAVDCCMVDTDLDFIKIKQKLILFNEGQVNLTAKIDFVICLGGDGTLIHASSLFQQSVPPIMAFNMGSLGFLTPFQFCHFKEEINKCLGGNASLLLRYRLKCVINCDNITSGSLSQTKTQDSSSSSTPCDQKAANTYLVLNEIVVDRGSTPYLCNIDLYIEGRLVTSVQGDGLIISTPTGSTAYAVAAGASMIHPNVPCLLITPICPHSLSFRPVVVPAGVEIKLMLSPEARSSAWVSFDGRNRIEINQGESLRITTARYPIPSICAKDQMNDWFDGLAECLHWNVRKQQKSLPSMSSTTSLNSLISDSETNN
ncbi:hypothetical protein SNE40_013755 [Patella caerulea]|uniref:NAD(+) kinase n=1 Tax=Patella caerulea TaxID=87958 RepID=A0AAN8JJX9_PATCE